MTCKKGIYVLLIEVLANVRIGKLGAFTFDGVYLYVGSALGPGGLKRVDRHARVAQGKNPTARWHVDYLLKAGRLKGAIITTTKRKIECKLANRISKKTIPSVEGFGASDCQCKTHLFRSKFSESRKIVYRAMKECGLKPRQYLPHEDI